MSYKYFPSAPCCETTDGTIQNVGTNARIGLNVGVSIRTVVADVAGDLAADVLALNRSSCTPANR